MQLDCPNLYRSELLSLLKLSRDYVSCKGDWLYDNKGNRVYDALSQYGTHIFGHNNAELFQRAANYLNGYNPNFIQPNTPAPTQRLVRKLKKTFGDRYDHVVFANSGTEAVEAAIKLARLKTGNRKIISIKNGFHGKTYAALSACGTNRHRIAGIFDDLHHLAIAEGDYDGFEAAIAAGDVAGFIFEPVQGEGGMRALDAAFIRFAIARCRSTNVVVIADEIQCGLGRCGDLAYSDTQNYKIDVILLGKGLGGGIVPIAAVLYNKRVYSKAFEKMHSSTFAGGGFACSVAEHVIDILTRDKVILSSVRHLSCSIDKQLQDVVASDGIKVSMTGVGLMRGIRFEEVPCIGNYFILFLQNSGVISYIVCSYLLHRYSIMTMPLMSEPCAIRFEPALTTSAVQIERFFSAIKEVALLLKNGRYDILMAHLIDVDTSRLPPPETQFLVENTDLPMISLIPKESEAYKDFDFAFLIHVASDIDLIKYLPRAIKLNFTPEEQHQIAMMMIESGYIDPSPDVALAFEVDNGITSRKGLMIFSPLTPKAMMRLSPREKLLLIDEYFAKATELGAKVVGLGAYTSVITRAGLDIADRYKGVSITTGNSLTAISTYEQFRSVYEYSPDVTAAIIGARGSVGRVVSMSILGDVPRVIFVGRANTSIDTYEEFLSSLVEWAHTYQGPCRKDSVIARVQQILAETDNLNESERLSAVVGKLCSNDVNSDREIVLTSDVQAALSQSKYVVSCTSEGKPFLDDRHLPEGGIALDAGRPFDFLLSRSGKAKVYEAGLVTQPHSFYYGDSNLSISAPGVNLACFSETIILSFEGASRNYSIGKTINYDDVKEIQQMAIRNNYHPCVIESTT